LATVPCPDAIKRGSNERDAATLRFQRLERVRARQRCRRRHRLILVITLVVAPAGAGVLGFTAVRRTSFELPGASRAQAPVGTSTPPAAPTLEPGSALGPPSTIAPRPVRTQGPKPDAAPRRRVQPDAPLAHGVAAPTNRVTGAPGHRRGDQGDAEVDDPTTAIDWLVKTSRARDQ
jgi:hypothetical protein